MDAAPPAPPKLRGACAAALSAGKAACADVAGAGPAGAARHGERQIAVGEAAVEAAVTQNNLGQGRDNSKNFLRDNPDLADEIETKIREKLGMTGLAPLVPVRETAAAE